MVFNKKWNNKTGTRTYYAWRSMRQRCTNNTNASWKSYGGRGVSVCPDWMNSYDNFVEAMGIAPMGASLDRINVDGDYTPENCRWATPKEQANNRRSNVILTHEGRSMTMAAWAEYLGIGKDTLHRRLRTYKMDLAKVLTAGTLIVSWEHGSRSGYERYKCKCAKCRAANTERHRKRRENLRGK